MSASGRTPVPLAGTEALEEALRRAVARGQAIADARRTARLATRLAAAVAQPRGTAAPPVLAARRYRVAEVTIAFEAEVRRDPSVAGGFAFVAAVAAGSALTRRSWPRRLFEMLRGRRIVPVTITFTPDAAPAAHRDATETGTPP